MVSGPFSAATLGLAAVVALLLAALAMLVTWLVARRVGRISVVDVTWGLLLAALSWAALLVAGIRHEAVTQAALASDPAVAGVPGWPARSLLVAGLASVWGCRLAWHIGRRAHGQEEDPRYAEVLASAPEAERGRVILRRVLLPQGLTAWWVGLPFVAAASTARPLGLVALLGVLVWAAGLLFESVGDAQLRAFKADPDNRGRTMDRGLWSWTRHPNYFGDACVWWGIWLVCAEAWPGLLTILSPAFMSYLLVRGTGAKLLERHMAQRPGYRDYLARTSGFIPRPPRRR